SEELAVSRTPIREALKQLLQEGLLESSSRGLKVRSYSLAEAIDIYEVRELLEAKAAYLAAERLKSQDRPRVEAMLEAMDTLKLDDSALYIQQDLDFHQFIAALSGNKALDDMISGLTGRLISLRVLTRDAIRSQVSHEQHRQIATAILAGEAAIAREHMLKHIRYFKNLLVNHLSQQQTQVE
ncbi:MAG: GntR family transcriptional regulator, partial [Deinococcales bacterium]